MRGRVRAVGLFEKRCVRETALGAIYRCIGLHNYEKTLIRFNHYTTWCAGKSYIPNEDLEDFEGLFGPNFFAEISYLNKNFATNSSSPGLNLELIYEAYMNHL